MLDFDISRCLSAADATCPLRLKCARWRVPGRPDGPQSLTAFPGGKDCDGYIDLENLIVQTMKAHAANCNRRARECWGPAAWETIPGAAQEAIMRVLCEHGPMTSREIEKLVGCSQQTVSNRIQRLKKANKVRVAGRRKVDYSKAKITVYEAVK